MGITYKVKMPTITLSERKRMNKREIATEAIAALILTVYSDTFWMESKKDFKIKQSRKKCGKKQ